MAKRILVVDDELPARSRLIRLLEETGEGFEILIAKNGVEALDLIASKNPDIVFLDIQMPGMTGLDVLQQIENRNFEIIFQTAYDEYALQAFEENACDYLLKPFEKERFLSALEKALAKKNTKEKLDQLEKSFHQKGQFLERIGVKVGEKLKSIHADEIYYFSSKDNYTVACTEAAEYLIDLSLSHLESRLNPKSFIRCHRSYMVNTQKILSLTLGPSMKAILANSSSIPISRQNRKAMKDLVNPS